MLRLTSYRTRKVLVTITGADHTVEPKALAELSERFPLVEWAFLYSSTRAGSPRYPWWNWIEKAARAIPWSASLALHTCGQQTRNIGAGDVTVLEHLRVLRPEWRVQLNGADVEAAMPQRLWEKYEDSGLSFIVQARTVDQVQDAARFTRYEKGVLYDPSGGTGQRPEEWPKPPLASQPIGYAGGIGEDNVRAVLDDVSTKAGCFWIDMESSVRTNDRFDLEKVERVLAIVHEWRANYEKTMIEAWRARRNQQKG